MRFEIRKGLRMVQGRYESELKRCISEIVLTELSDPAIGWVTINDVRLSSDYRIARVFVSVLDDEQVSLMALERASGFIRSLLAKRLPWRRMPKIKFELYKEELDREQGIDRYE